METIDPFATTAPVQVFLPQNGRIAISNSIDLYAHKKSPPGCGLTIVLPDLF